MFKATFEKAPLEHIQFVVLSFEQCFIYNRQNVQPMSGLLSNMNDHSLTIDKEQTTFKSLSDNLHFSLNI